jgi:uncharacterized protein (TIGR04141 family)
LVNNAQPFASESHLPLITLYRLADPAPDHNDDLAQVLSPGYDLEEVTIKAAFPGRLFVARSEPQAPEWVSYLKPLVKAELDVGTRSTTGAALLIWPYKNRRTAYAVTWGNGHQFLQREVLYRDLGLRAALNLMTGKDKDWDPNRLRSVKTKRVGPMTLLSQLQASQKSSFEAFPIDLEGDQLRQVTGAPLDPKLWGASVTGGTSLHVRRPTEVTALVDVCKRVEKVYRSDEYRTKYGWIDNIMPVNDAALTADVLRLAAARIRQNDPSLIVSPPDLVSWEEVDHFEYHVGRDKVSVDEPTVDSLRTFLEVLGFLPAEDDPSVTFTGVKLSIANDSGDRLETWPLLECLSCEVRLGDSTYVLDDAGVFLVSKDYLKAVDSFMASLKESDLSFPKPSSNSKEGPYNVGLATAIKRALLLDRKNVVRANATPIEVCDVALASKSLIHVKRGCSSSTLSHLFAQGAVSADLLHMDAEFRKALKKRIGASPQGSGASNMGGFSWLYSDPFPSSDCTVSYAILTGSSKPLKPVDLPFFSKVNLRRRCQELRRMGFSYTLDLVPNK